MKSGRRVALIAFIYIMCGIFAAPGLKALPADYYAHSSALAAGKWVKVKVTESGMQQISFEALRQMGFADPAKVAVCGYSGIELADFSLSESQADDLPSVPVIFSDDKLIFYADAVGLQSPLKANGSADGPRYNSRIFRNFFNDHAVFFLTDTREPLIISKVTTEVDPAHSPLDRSQGFLLKDFKDVKPGNIGAFMFGAEDMGVTPRQTFDLYLPGFDPDGDGPDIETGLGMMALSPRIVWSLPGATSVTQTVTGYGSYADYKIYYYGKKAFRYEGAVKCDGDIYPLSMDAAGSSDLKNGWVDYMAAIYPRRNDMAGLAQSVFGFPKLEAGQVVVFTDAPATLRVWDVTRNSVPREFAVTAADDGSASFVADGDREMTLTVEIPRFIAFDPAAQLCEPQVIGDVENQNLHAMSTPDMIVIASENCYAQASRLTDIHRRYTGKDVAVVRAGQVYNEFSSGLAHPQGLRRFVKMLYDRDPAKLQAVLLFAAANVDNTGITFLDTREKFDDTFIPMLESQNPGNAGIIPKSYASDAIVGMLADNLTLGNDGDDKAFREGQLTIPVSRIPASNYGDAMAYVDKLERYLADPGTEPVYNHAVILTDERNKNALLDQGEVVRGIIKQYSPATTVHAYHFALYDYHNNMNRVKEHLIQTLQRGAGLWAFLGHSTGPSIGGFWDAATDLATSVKHPPFTVFGSCVTLGMDNTGANSIQVNMTHNPIGGMLGGVGSIRSVYLDYNDDVCNAIVRSFYTGSADATYGDVYLRGRNSFVSSSFGNNTNAMYTLLNYNLAGDPLIPVNAPAREVVATEINGNPYVAPAADADPAVIPVNPLQAVEIKGEIRDAEGVIDESFNGTLTVMFYDAPRTADNNHSRQDEDLRVVTLDDKLLYEAKLPVVDGRYSGTFHLPEPDYVGGNNTVSLYAISDDAATRAVGSIEGMQISRDADQEAAAAAVAPEITEMYLNSPDIPEGATFTSAPTLFAEVAADELGLLGMSDRVGGAFSLLLDGHIRQSGADSYFTLNADGSGSLEYSLSDLPDGRHTLTLRVLNVAGLSAERTISFNIAKVAEATLALEGEFARDEATFTLAHNLSAEPAGRLVITSRDGSTVFTDNNATFPYTWNLKDNDGAPLPDGRYTASFYFFASPTYGSALPLPFTLAR